MERFIRGHRESLGLMDVHYLDLGFFFLIGVYMSKYIKMYTSNMCSLLYVNYYFSKVVKNKLKLISESCEIKLIYVKYTELYQAPGELSGTHYRVSDSVLGVESTRKNKAD